jgi:hypothetical protein
MWHNQNTGNWPVLQNFKGCSNHSGASFSNGENEDSFESRKFEQLSVKSERVTIDFERGFDASIWINGGECGFEGPKAEFTCFPVPNGSSVSNQPLFILKNRWRGIFRGGISPSLISDE